MNDSLSPIGLWDHAQSLDPRLSVAVQAANAAGLTIRNGLDDSLGFQDKGWGDLASEVDRRAEIAAVEVLNRLTPERHVIAEEFSPDDQGKGDDTWLVDPLDASAALIMQDDRNVCSTLIALREQGRTEIGVALFPFQGDWYYAVRGRGAWKNGKRLVLSGPDYSLDQGWVDLNCYSNASLETNWFRSLRDGLRGPGGARLVTTHAPNSGAACRLIEGAGRLVAVVHDNRSDHVKQAAWDIAAVQLIVEEAGGVMWNAAGENVDPFACEPFVVARSPSVAEQILAIAQNGSDLSGTDLSLKAQ